MALRLLLVCAVWWAAAAVAAESPATRKAREELEQQLAALVQTPPPRLEFVYAPPPELGYQLAEAEFVLDGHPLASPPPETLNAGGTQVVFRGEVTPGRHELVTRLVFVETSARVFTYMAGYRWKLGARSTFEVPAGLALRVRALPRSVPDAQEPKARLTLTHDSAVRLTAQVEPPAALTADAGAASPDAGFASSDAGVGALASVELAPEVIAPPKDATLLVTATSKKKPVAARVRVEGDDAPAGATAAQGSEPLRIPVAAGPRVVEVEGKGYLARTRVLDVAAGTVTAVEFELAPAPKKPQVVDGGKTLKLATPLRFLPGKTALAPGAAATLAQVVDVVVRAHLKKLKVEVHTDNRGVAAELLKLSSAQAEAIAAALREAGLAPARVEAEGLGDTRPVAPNLTPRGRDRNRRVELLVLER